MKAGRTWVIADTHFGHKGVCHFTRNDGSDLRPWGTPEEMDEAMVALWNDIVHDVDRVYILGDLVINRRCLPTVSRLKGRKVLVKGNHDIFKLKDYTPYFDDIRAYVVGKCHSGKMYIMSHIPIHPACLGDRWAVNIHGHLHSNTLDDPKYICVSVEQTGFKPTDLNDIIKDR